MTSSIVLTDTILIDFNKKDKFKYKDSETVYEFERQEIPVVRYRFNRYGLNELVYIKNNLRKFNFSLHLVEMKLCEDTLDWINRLSDLKEVPIFLYLDLTKENIVTRSFTEVQRNLLVQLRDKYMDRVERIMMKDVDGVLHMMVAKPLINNLSALLGINSSKIGYCSCAFSANGLCCLTAERARDIAARYSTNEHFAIATNVVEGMNQEQQVGCNCIRHIIISHDIEQDENAKEEVKADGNVKVVKLETKVADTKLQNVQEALVSEQGKKSVNTRVKKEKAKSGGKLKIPKNAF